MRFHYDGCVSWFEADRGNEKVLSEGLQQVWHTSRVEDVGNSPPASPSPICTSLATCFMDCDAMECREYRELACAATSPAVVEVATLDAGGRAVHRAPPPAPLRAYKNMPKAAAVVVRARAR